MNPAHRPLFSLISKSEKALLKLQPGTWQHTMLSENLTALRLAIALLTHPTDATAPFTPQELRDTLPTMISKTQTAQAKFPPGTSQHTLLQNRLQALHLAETTIKARAG